MSIKLGALAFSALWLFVFSLPWERSIAVPVVGSIGSLFGLVAFAMGFLSLFSKQGLRLRVPSLLVLTAAAFTLWSFLSYFWSIAPTASFNRSQTYAQLLLVTFLVWQLCRNNKQLRALLQAYVWGAYVSCASIMASFILGLSFANSGRYSGLSGDNPNWIAITLALGIPIAWHLASMYRNAWLSWINFFYLPTSLLAIGLTASRGGFINALVGMSLILFSFRSLSLTRKAFLLFLIPIGIYGVLNTVPPENLTRLSEASAEISEGDMTSRGAIWAAGLRIIAERPWLGYGIGSFSTAVASELGSAMNAHNSFISIMAELGVVGIMLFVLLFYFPSYLFSYPILQIDGFILFCGPA